MEIKKHRIMELLNNCIDYISEAKEPTDNIIFWQNVIGMTDDELEYFYS